MEKVHGRVLRVLFRAEDSGYTIIKLADGNVVCGKMEVAPVFDCDYTFTGSYTTHPKFGRQLRFSGYKEAVPSGKQAVLYYLAKRAPHIKHERAHMLLKEFGDRAIEVLKHDPELVAQKIPGITLERAIKAQAALRECEGDQDLLIDIVTALGGERLSANILEAIKDAWGREAPEIIRHVPYKLVDIHGIGFGTADRIARGNGVAFDDPSRIEAGIMYLIKTELPLEGHICLPRVELEQHAKELLGGAEVGAVLDILIEHNTLVSDTAGIYLHARHVEEQEIVAQLELLSYGATRVTMEGSPPDDLAEDQRRAFEAAKESNIFLLTGAPGVGKTYTIKALLGAFDNTARIALCAPTGKASRVMSEATGKHAQTVHRLLEPAKGRNRFYFRRGKLGRAIPVWEDGQQVTQRPLDVDVVVLDEASMLDQWLFRQLLDAVPLATRIIIVGDHYQLPSVGAGNVLRDLIAAGVPNVELTQIKRQAEGGEIVAACHRIKEGGKFEWRNEEGSDLMFIPTSSEAGIGRFIVEAVAKRLPEKYGWDWRKGEIQCITGIHASQLGTKNLNERLEAELVPEKADGTTFRMGGRYIQTKNDYELNILNGDIGTVIELGHRADEPYIKLKFDAYEKPVDVHPIKNKLQPAYALTVHKFQGSEAPCVIIPIHKCLGGRIPSRSWLYTALSRGKKLTVLVGDESQLPRIIKRVEQHERYTGLARRLRELLESIPLRARRFSCL